MTENTMFHVKHTEKQPFVAPFLAPLAEIVAQRNPCQIVSLCVKNPDLRARC